MLQGLSVFVIILPGLLVWREHTDTNLTIILGLTIWLIGLVTETVADFQKYNFKLRGAKMWIDEGVWKASRHPNYLGEILVWLGFYIVSFTALSGIDRAIALLSPVYIAFVLLRVSGVPILEKSADQKWGQNKSYLVYKRNVPVLVPNRNSLKRLYK